MIPPRELRHRLQAIGKLDPQVPRETIECFLFPLRIEEKTRLESGQVRQGKILQNRPAQHEALLLPILHEQADAGCDGVARAGDADLPTIQPDPSRNHRVRSEKHPQDRCPPRSDETGKADDFTRPDGKSDAVDTATIGQSVDDEAFRADRHVARRKLRIERTTDHLLDEIGTRRFRYGTGVDLAAVPQDEDAVGNGKDLLKSVAHVNHGELAVRQFPDDGQEPCDLRRSQRRGGLVHDDDPGIERQRLGNLHDLSLGDRQLAAGDVGINLDSEARDQLLRPAPFSPTMANTSPRCSVSETSESETTPGNCFVSPISRSSG